jgi:hypothetical protein
VYLADNRSIQKHIANVEFSYNKLLALFNRYYDNKNTRPVIAGSKQKARLELSAIAGASYTKTRLQGSEVTIMDHYTPSADFTGGVSADIYLPGRLNLISVSNDFLYNAYDTRASSRSNSTNYYVERESHIVASYIKMYNQVRYRFKINKSFLYLNAGLSHGLALDIRHTVVKETVLNGEVMSRENENGINEFRKIEEGYLFGVGGRRKKLSLELRYEKGNGISPYSHFQTANDRFILLAGYSLF